MAWTTTADPADPIPNGLYERLGYRVAFAFGR
jgi:hypothetical protein